MNLEASFQLSKTRIEDSMVARRAKLYGKFPVKELIRRAWVKEAKDLATIEANFCRFFHINSIDEPPTFQHAAKKCSYDDSAKMLQLAWLNRAEQVAQDIEARSFSAAALKDAIQSLKRCLREVEDVKNAAPILAKAGVRLVVVEYLPGAKLDGACFWINKGKSPVIALSLRLDRIDNFWHTLFHELDHIANGEGKDVPIVDVVDVGHAGISLPPQEQRANMSAANYCIDQREFRTWIAHTPRVSTRGSIVAFADKVGVHPGLVVGQLQHSGEMPYSFHRDFLEKVRSLVIASTPTDGFGAT
jgi:HTH-type transcriptional regulator/antitoxin HigA